MFRVMPYRFEYRTVLISKHSNIASQLSNISTVTIKYGLNSLQTRFKLSNFVKENEIHISIDIIDALDIPLTSGFFLHYDSTKLLIGPYIGILAELSNTRLSYLIPTLTSFLRSYDEIGGTIVAFALEGVDKDKQQVTGYMYNPNKENWEHGTFPYPASVLSITEASLTSHWQEFEDTMKHFKELMGPAVFNYPSFSKWEMYQLLKEDFHTVLPKTIPYHTSEDLKLMIERHQSIFVKPLNGRLGKSIYQAKRINKRFNIRFRENQKLEEYWIENEDHFYHAFHKRLESGDYLIQESIPLMKHNNRVIDFRVILAKNGQGNWEHSGVFARYGESGSIISNITAGGRAEIAELALRKVWKLNDAEIIDLKKKMIHLSLRAIRKIEKHGYHCGNIGFDIGIDKNLSMWIIEINNQNPDPYIANRAKHSKYFYKTRLLNMLYAKRLAGF